MLKRLPFLALHVLPKLRVVVVFTEEVVLPGLKALEKQVLATVLHLPRHQLPVLLLLGTKREQLPEG